MFKAKKYSMYIDVTGVDDMTDRRTLMEEIIRRNCDVDPRIIKSLVNKLGRCGDENHKKCNYELRLENYDLCGVARDFELLKKAGIIEHVSKVTNYERRLWNDYHSCSKMPEVPQSELLRS